MDDKTLEDELQAKAKAPRVTLNRIEQSIKTCVFFNVGAAATALGLPTTEGMDCTTACYLTLDNGYVVYGSSTCVSIENYDEDIGRKIARQKAVDQIWALEGYALKSRLSRDNADWGRGDPPGE